MVVNAIPHLWNTMGNERTTPPTIVAIRLNDATNKLDLRSVESKGGAKWSWDWILCCSLLLLMLLLLLMDW